jgi:hypothetical protein
MQPVRRERISPWRHHFWRWASATSETLDSDTVFEDINAFDKELESGDEVSDV